MLDELESIVYSGTKINIGYAVAQMVEEEKLEEIYDYFKTAETDDIETAIKELDAPDITEEEIRLVRLKFISEVGN
jgi:ATP-dependent DNA helicase RecQ